MLCLAPVDVPTNFKIRPISSTIIKVSWDPPPIYFQNGIITQYILTYHGIIRDTKLETINVTVTNGTTYVLPLLVGLEEHTYYNVSVRAVTTVGLGPATTDLTQTYQDCKFNLNGLLFRSLRLIWVIHSFC